MSDKPKTQPKARSYGSYLKVPELLQLQQELSDPPHHDEMLFIVIHQVYELWFKQMLHEVDEVVRALSAADTRLATRLCRRLIEIQRVLLQQIPVLETMRPPDFMEFREHLNPASGFQSYQFRTLEFRSGLKEPRYLAMHQADPAATAMLMEALGAPSLSEAWEAHLRSRGLDYPERVLMGAVTDTAGPSSESAGPSTTRTGDAGPGGAPHFAGTPGTPPAGTSAAGSGQHEGAARSAGSLQGLGCPMGPHAPTSSGEASAPAADDPITERRMASLLKIYTDRKDLYDLYILAEALIEYDENFMLWRQHHVLMVERMIGMKQGTGGSEGVGYLRSTLGRKCFPDLWTVRTHISGASEYGQ